MKIEFDKALLWLLPYLYLVSVMYYWGYWGTFDIDVFNYYPVSDLVKGVTAPVTPTLRLAACFSLAAALGRYITPSAKRDAIQTCRRYGFVKIPPLSRRIIMARQIIWPAIFCYLVIMAYMVMIAGSTTGGPYKLFIIAVKMSLLFLVIPLTYAINFSLPRLGSIKDTIRSSAILFACLLPVNAYIDGSSNSLAIKYDREFDYVVILDKAIPTNIYKYLGKAGEYHFLLTFDNNKRIIMPTDKVMPLTLEHYSTGDTASMSRLNRSIQQLSALSSKESSSSQQ